MKPKENFKLGQMNDFQKDVKLLSAYEKYNIEMKLGISQIYGTSVHSKYILKAIMEIHGYVIYTYQQNEK